MADFQAMVKTSPKLRQDVLAAVETVKRMTAPLDRNQVYICLQPLIVMYGPPDFPATPEGAALSNMWLDLHTAAYRSVPREALEFAVSEYIRIGPAKFRVKARPFPDPDVLVKLAEPKAVKLNQIAWRLRKGAEVQAFDRESEAAKADREKFRAEAEALGALRPDGTVDATALLRHAKAQKQAAQAASAPAGS